jgi:hypothetical protein
MGKNRDRRDIESALESKGFIKKEGSNHKVYVFKHKGLSQAVSTIISRGSSYKVYGSSLLGQMSTQLNLTNKQLLDLIDCPMSKKDFVENLKSRGIIS